MSIAEVKVLYPSNYRDVVATLRYIADEVEKGSYGEVSLGGLVLMADQCQVFGMGRDDMGGNPRPRRNQGRKTRRKGFALARAHLNTIAAQQGQGAADLRPAQGKPQMPPHHLKR